MSEDTVSYIEDVEEAFRVIKIDEGHYVGAHPLRLPLPAARGVFGGNTIGQTILVGIESAPSTFVPHSFHSYFLAPGKSDTPMEYFVTKLTDDTGDITKRFIKVQQKGKVRFTALVSFIRRGLNFDTSHDFQKDPESLHYKHPDPSKAQLLRHTDYIRNAFTDEFIDHKLVPEEDSQAPADRWINVWSGIHQQNDKINDQKYQYVGLGGVSDSVFLTTLARILHAPWNPTETRSFEEVDLDKDARMWMNVSLNALHIFHYNAMSLDHHLYFHSEDFDLANDWLTFNYQARRVSNNRTLVRGYFYNSEGKKIATAVQEGLTLAFKGFDTVPDNKAQTKL